MMFFKNTVGMLNASLSYTKYKLLYQIRIFQNALTPTMSTDKWSPEAPIITIT